MKTTPMVSLFAALRWMWREWARARRQSFFFAACPMCGRPFSGEEAMTLEGNEALMITASEGKIVCGLLSCQRRARELNTVNFPNDPFVKIRNGRPLL